jgi:hypothetical protein
LPAAFFIHHKGGIQAVEAIGLGCRTVMAARHYVANAPSRLQAPAQPVAVAITPDTTGVRHD